MNPRKTAYGLLGCLLLLASTQAFAQAPVRGASKNGQDSNAAFWSLFGPTAAVPPAGPSVKLALQVVCTAQANASANLDNDNAGWCSDGKYTFLYQIQSTKKIMVTISNLVGFTPFVDNTNLLSTYGVELCDTPNNTLELCTTADASQLPPIDISISATNDWIRFKLPKFSFPAGTGRQGQGLTLVLVVEQTPGQPVVFPKIAIK